MRKLITIIERTAWILGAALMLVYLAACGHRAVHKASDLQDFKSAKAEARESDGENRPVSAPPGWDDLDLDTSLWDEGRIRKYEEARGIDADLPLAILRIPKIDLEVPVREGTGEMVLNRAVGRIPGTENVDGEGNIGIAGHRDGFFRGLKDVEPGDTIEIETLTQTRFYRIYDTSIVEPEDVEVLAPTLSPAVTLVTCYPFYFVGNAPQRYIVRAVLLEPLSSSGTE